jgi:hypothetical protein
MFELKKAKHYIDLKRNIIIKKKKLWVWNFMLPSASREAASTNFESLSIDVVVRSNPNLPLTR